MSQRAPYLLDVQALSLAHSGGVPFVCDINFALHAGESLVILGPNGSGKTTLLRTLLGLQTAGAGSVQFEGKPDASTFTQCAYVPQSCAGFSGFSASEVIQIGLMARKPWYAKPSVDEAQKAETALAQLGIAALADADFSTLSGGEQQLVLIARALAMDARIIFLDEPAASLDIANQSRFNALCVGLKQSGVALVLTTHNPQQALALSQAPQDQVLTISQEGEVTVGATSTVCTTAHLSNLYGVPVEVLPAPGGPVVRY